MTIKTGDQAYHERRMEDAEQLYKQAVALARNLPPEMKI